MKRQLIFVLVAMTALSCQPDKAIDSADYPNQFGEIPFDAAMDDSSFKLCDSTNLVHSRVSLSYVGGRGRVEEISKEIFAADANEYAFDGYVVARFLVNCNGEVGRLRFESLDDGFMEQEAPGGLIALVRKAVNALNEWTITQPAYEGKDHSKYLNFKLINGQIDAIIH